MIVIGQLAPQFEGVTQEGGSFSLMGALGKHVVLYFYPKDNTPGCTLEARAFRNLYEEFFAENALIIGVSADSEQAHDHFIQKQCLNFPLISDHDRSICRLYGVLKQKSLFGKKYMGIERATFLIDKTGIVQQVWRNILSPAGHVAKVLSAVKLLNQIG